MSVLWDFECEHLRNPSSSEHWKCEFFTSYIFKGSRKIKAIRTSSSTRSTRSSSTTSRTRMRDQINQILKDDIIDQNADQINQTIKDDIIDQNSNQTNRTSVILFLLTKKYTDL